MAEESFFSMFAEKLPKSIKDLVPMEPHGSWARSLYLSRWNPYSASSNPNSAVVVCDGSLGESSFMGGLVAWVARAVAHIYARDGSVATMPDVAVEVGYMLEGQSLFMKSLELQVLRKAVEKALWDHKRVFAVFDGSLYLTFFHYLPRLESVVGMFERYLKELGLLLQLSREDGVAILGLSKDSDVSYLRARILLDALLGVDADVGRELALRERSVRRIAERLRSRVEGLPKESLLRSYLMEFELGFSDEGLYSEIASEPGFTTPLLLAPQTHFVTEEIERGTRSWWESTFRKRLERSEKLSPLMGALDGFYALPPIAIFYWKPRPELGAYRVDTPSNLLGYRGDCGSLQEDIFTDDRGLEAVQSLVATLNWLSREPYVVNPLTEVDAIVRFDRRLYKQAYEPVIIEELRKKGFKIFPRKRSVRDFVLRGY